MSLSIGIIGLPNVGKSTLFNALLKRQQALAANYPFATIEPNIGVVDVPDQRMDKLAQIIKDEYQSKYSHKEVPEKIVPAVIKFYDIAGLIKGAHKGEGLGNQFLSHIKEVDAIVHVVRAFENSNIIREGSTDPKTDIETINMELILADLQSIEKKLEKINLDIKRARTEESLIKLNLYQKIYENLEKGLLSSQIELKETEEPYFDELNLLTSKPMIYVINIEESTLIEGNKPDLSTINGHYGFNHDDAIYICAQIEAEIIQLEEEERKEFMDELSIKVTGLDKVIRRGYKILDLETYFTAGPKEVHAWTIQKGTKAPQAAGKIHSDFERGFISAEVVSYKNLVESGSWKVAKEKGLSRIEGKNYVMNDGDVVEFRFSV